MAVNRFNKRKEFEARDRFMRAFSTRKLASAAAVAATAAVVEARWRRSPVLDKRAILSIIRAFIASQPLVIRHSALLLRTMASVAATIAVVRASATKSGGGSPAEKQKREKRPSENRPRGGWRVGGDTGEVG